MRKLIGIVAIATCFAVAAGNGQAAQDMTGETGTAELSERYQRALDRLRAAGGRNLQIAQSYSPRCQTPAGICYVDAQPVGAPCYCNETGQSGTIVP